MTKAKLLTICLAAGCVLGFQISAARAETVEVVKATGVAVIDNQNFKLSDGSTVQQFSSRTVWTSTEAATAGQSHGVTCRGLGKVTADGVYSGDSICDENLSAEDTLVSDYKDTAEGGDWVIIGGTGKYKGAKGSGHVTYTWGDAVFGDKITMTNEGSITLP